MTLTEIGNAAFEGAQQITDAIDGPVFYLHGQELFERHPHNL